MAFTHHREQSEAGPEGLAGVRGLDAVEHLVHQLGSSHGSARGSERDR